MSVATAERIDPRQYLKEVHGAARVYKQVGIEEIDFFGRFGAKVFSTTQNTIAIGEKQWTVDTDAAKVKVGDDMQWTARGQVDCYMYGTVVAKDTTTEPARISCVINDVSELDGTFADWEGQVVSRPKAWLEVDVSTSDVDPTDAGPFTMVVTAGKLYPIGGGVTLRSIEKPGVVILTRVRAYSGTSLVLDKFSTNSAVSETLSSWDVALIDGPQDGLLPGQITGLRLVYTGIGIGSVVEIYMTAGKMRDAADTVDLVLPAQLDKRTGGPWVKGADESTFVQSANLTGTVETFLGNSNLSGTGTAFLTELSVGCLIQLSNGRSAAIATITDNDTATMTAVATNASGLTFKRGVTSSATASKSGTAVICLIREDATGDIDYCLSSYDGNDNVDLPSGWSLYGLVGECTYTATSNVLSGITHFSDAALTEQLSGSVLAPKILYRATITPTALGINCSAVNATTDVCTFPAHGCSTGECVILTGTVPAGLTTEAPYYLRALDGPSEAVIGVAEGSPIGDMTDGSGLAAAFDGDTTQDGSGGLIPTVVSGGVGTNIGDMTANGGLAAAFDGNTNQAAGAGAGRGTAVSSSYCGKNYSAAPKKMSKAVVHGSNNEGYVTTDNPSTTLTLYGKNGSAPGSDTDGTSLGTTTFTDTANESAGRTVNSSDTSTAWDYVWVRCSHTGTARNQFIAEIVFWEMAVGPAASATKETATTFAVGKDYSGTPQKINSAIVYGGNDTGFAAAANPSVTLTLRGLNGSVPSNYATDGTQIGTLTAFTDTADESAGRTITCTDTVTDWDYVWVYGTHDGSAGTCVVAEVEFVGPIVPTSDDISLHTTRSGADDGTSIVNITGTTTGWSFRRLIETLVTNTGLEEIGPFGGVGALTTIQLDFFPSTPLSASGQPVIAQFAAKGLANSAASVATQSWEPYPSSMLANGSISFRQIICRVDGAVAITVTGTWAQQGVNQFILQLVVWYP